MSLCTAVCFDFFSLNSFISSWIQRRPCPLASYYSSFHAWKSRPSLCKHLVLDTDAWKDFCFCFKTLRSLFCIKWKDVYAKIVKYIALTVCFLVNYTLQISCACIFVNGQELLHRSLPIWKIFNKLVYVHRFCCFLQDKPTGETNRVYSNRWISAKWK